jgi:hypothetical protein
MNDKFVRSEMESQLARRKKQEMQKNSEIEERNSKREKEKRSISNC